MNQILHYILTVQWSEPQGANNVTTVGGTIYAENRTREQLLAFLFTVLTAKHGAPAARTSILYFSLEPNVLGQAA